MNFRKVRKTCKETGEQVRALDVSIVNVSKDVEDSKAGLVIFTSDNTLFLAMEREEFQSKYVDGWLSKEELGLEEDTDDDSLLEKISDKIEDFKDDVVETAQDIKEAVGDIASAVAETIDDVGYELKEGAEDIAEVVSKPKKKTTKKK